MSNALILTQLGLQAALQLQDYFALLAKAKAENRDVTDEELDAAAARYGVKREAVMADIAQARAEGR